MKVLVCDTAAILSGLVLSSSLKKLCPSSVISEVKDLKSVWILETALKSGKLEVRDPKQKYVSTVIGAAKATGDILSISKTDIEVLALALELMEEGYEAIILTDDYSLQNVSAKLGVKTKSIKTMGIRGFFEYEVVCPACGFREEYSYNTHCPRCGHRLLKRRKKYS